MVESAEKTREDTWVPKQWVEEIKENLDYGESMSGYIRDSIRLRRELENADELIEEFSDE